MGFFHFLRSQYDRVGAGALALAGLAALVAGWFGASGSVYPAEQIPYVISGGMVGLFLLAAGGTLWVSADLRDEWRKLDRLEELLDDEAPPRSGDGDR